jgi:hypothetical protein
VSTKVKAPVFKVPDVKFEFNSERVYDYDPDMLDDIATIEHFLQSTCKDVANEKFPHFQIKRIETVINYDECKYSYRLCQGKTFNRTFTSSQNSLLKLTSLKDVYTEFMKFIESIDRTYYVH